MGLRSRVQRLGRLVPKGDPWADEWLGRIDAMSPERRRKLIDELEEARPRFRPDPPVQRLITVLQDYARQ